MTEDNGTDPDQDEEPAEELFPVGALEGDARVTAQNIIRKGLPVTVTVALSQAEVPTRAGLLNPDKTGRVMVNYVPGKLEPVPERGDDGKVKAWKIRQHLRATFVTDANDEASVARNAFAALVATDASAAAELHAEMGQVLKAELQTA